MNILTAIFLGIIQGLTEFLPVSSSGHLVLFQKIFGIQESALLFDTMVHVGTLVAVCAVLWQDIWAILRRIIQPLTGYLIIATIPAVICALAFTKPIENLFASGKLLGFSFIITAIFLAGAELLSRRANRGEAEGPVPGSKGTEKSNGMEKNGHVDITKNAMNWLKALIIGIMQAIAIIPGVSRSGATISGALGCKLNRDFAARFSFLLSIPAILGALILQVHDLMKNKAALPVDTVAAQGGHIGTAVIIAGTLSAAIVGFFAVQLMLKIIREKSLWGFVIYTGVLGLLVTLDQFIFHVIF